MRVAFYTLGCKLNQAETESLAGQFSQAGHQIVAPNDRADIYIANTCTVTHIADRKSRHWLRLVRRRYSNALIIATGCYAQRVPKELAPLADLALGNEEKERLLEIVTGLSTQAPSSVMASTSSSHCERSEATPPLENTARVRSLLKIQDGCQTPCTYCIVPRVRPHEYSLAASRIVENIKSKMALGHKEVILTGTKVGCYNNDGMTLLNLMQHILTETDVKRLRLSSLQPQEISPELLALWQDDIQSAGKEPRLCRHFHLALQNGSDAVLQRMERSYSLDDYVKALSLIRKAIPGVAITTDIMVGFPGESAEEFEQSSRFCQKAGFANIHVFPFSPRPDTKAAEMPNQVKDKVKQEHTQQMLKLSQNCQRSFCEQFLGQTLLVLWEKETSPGSGIYSGLTDNYIRVFAQSSEPLTNRITSVKLTGFHNDAMWGELDNEDLY